MKKRYLSMLLAILMLLMLTVYAFAEEADGEVSAAAGNSIEFKSIDEVAWDHITFTVELNVTSELAADGYRIGIFYSPDQNFSLQSFQFKDTFGTGDTSDHLFHYTSGEYQFTRYIVEILPDKMYSIRPMLFSGNPHSFDEIATGSTWNVAGPVGNGDYTNMVLNQPVVPTDYTWAMIHAKFTAVEGGQYALVGNEDMEFISYGFPDGYHGETRYSVYADHGDGTTSRTVLKLFLDIPSGETVYLFGKRADDTTGNGELTIVPAADVAPTENSIEASAPVYVSNINARFNFTVSTTAETAQNGYHVGIVYGDHGTAPETWRGRISSRPEYSIQSSTTMTYGFNGDFVPGMDMDYQAALYDAQTGEILARGEYIGRVQTPDTFDGLTELTKDTPYNWNNPGMKYCYFTAPADGMYAVQGSGMSPLRLTDRTNQDLGVGYLLGSYLKAGETFFPVAYNNAGNDCTVTVTDGLGTFRSVEVNDGSSQYLNETTPAWFQAPESGIYRFAIDQNSPVDLLMVNENGDWQQMGKEFEIPLEKNQILWLRRSSGTVSNLGLTAEKTGDYITSDLDLRDRETYQITRKTIVAEGVRLDFAGTELQIEPGVTLTILGSAEGDAVVAEGTLRVSGDSAYFRTGASFREEDSGKLEIDGHGYAELASNSTANNAYLDPDMNIEFTNEGSVTFGYFVPSEEYMRSLLSTLDNSNPNIRLDLQFYSGITLSDDLALPEHVTLHTDYNWGQGAGFTIPAGKTLTIPEAGGFYAFTSPIDIEGNLVNNGEVVLGSVENAEPYPTICDMTLLNGGSYSGNGYVSVETLENPLSYLSGFESYRMNETWRDESNNRITYQLIKTYNYRADNGLGEYTLPGSLTIKPGEQLLADTLIIPADATLTVNGSAYAYNALVINQGGALIIGDDARFELYNMQAPPTDTIINGTITLGNNAGLYMGLGHWTNSNIKNAITVTGQDALIQVDYHHSSSAPKTVNEMLGVITGDAAAVPSELEPYVSKLFSLCIPYEATADLVIPEGIQFRVLNNGSDETGSLTIPQGVGLTIPNGAHLVLAGANLTVNGTVNNSGQVELRTYRGGPDGTMPIFTLGDGADYQGKGQIWVRSYQENPVQYLVGFDGNKLSMINRDDMGGQFLYVDLNAVFEAFREACDLENHPDYYDLNDLGEFTILDDLTIPAGMQVDAWGTTLVIPDGVTLNVAGGLGCEALDVKEGGTVHAEGTGDFAWANVDVNEITCAGSSEVGDWSNFNINIYGWNETVANHLVVSDNGNVWINVPINNETEFQEGLLAAESFNTYSASIQGMNMNINYPCVLPDGFRINGQFMYHVHDNEYSHGSLTVPEGAMVTMTADSFVFMHGSSFIVSGTIENNGMIELCEAEYGGGDTGRLVIAEGGNYTGNGIVEVNASENPKSYITGIDQRRILTAWEDADNSWYAYRITETVPTVIADGSTFSFTTSDEGIFQNQYSCGILVTPQEDGLYSFTLSFANDPKIHWDEAWLGINGTDLQDQSFDTDEPASLVFSAMMYSGEGYELVFSNLAKLNAVTVNVSVSKASDGFTERLNAMAANPYQRFHVAIAAEDLTGLTALNVPINVTLDVDGELTIPSGLTVSCYGDFSVNQGGALHIPEGAMLNLIPDADWRTYGCVILDGGTLDAAANTMSFEGRACVQLQNRNYLSNEAALNAVSGVAISDITLEVEILSQSDYEYWYNVKASGYKDANLILLNGFHLTLSSDLPEGYCLVVNEGATVTVPDGTDAVLYGYIAMEGGGFTNNGLLTVDETAGINIWADGSQVTNNGTINLNGSIQSGNAFALTNNGDFTVMNAQAIPAKITFSPNLYHYPNEHRLVLPASLTSIETEAFANTAAWEVDLPDGIGSIGDGAFANADDLFLVVIPNGNASITGNPFQGSGNVIIAAPSGDSVNQFADGEQIPFIALAPQTQG